MKLNILATLVWSAVAGITGCLEVVLASDSWEHVNQ